MTRSWLVFTLAVVLLAAVTASAHHSQAAQYDTNKKVSIEGTMVQFQFRNPHSFVQVEAPDETGQVVRWSIEWGGSGQLTGQGVSRTTLKYGDVVTITANPSRTPNDHKLHMLTLHRKSDGFGWGTRPGEVTD
jgi:cell division protein FtsW (lipid II flippase)